MKRITVIILSCIVLLLFSVSCGGDWIVDDSFKATITFNGNGATSGTMEAMEVGKGIPIGLNANVFQRPDLPFRCWNTESDGSGTQYTDGQYIAVKENTTLYAQWGTTITESTTSWTDGNRYVLDSNVTISERITVTGSATLVLRDGYLLTASEGIGVNEGNSLTIQAEGAGTGELIANGPSWWSGIGGNDNCSTGTIVINSGHVSARGGNRGAGIGGSATSSVGTITINGGTVTANGGDDAAGIGLGYGAGGGGLITINGGIVNAQGGKNAAGIGKGHTNCDGISLIINNGTVTASVSYGRAAGIGGGYGVAGIDVTINGGTVNASGGMNSFSLYGMGIGNGGSGSNGALTLGPGVALMVREDEYDWADYDGYSRTQYMKTI